MVESILMILPQEYLYFLSYFPCFFSCFLSLSLLSAVCFICSFILKTISSFLPFHMALPVFSPSTPGLSPVSCRPSSLGVLVFLYASVLRWR